MTDVADVINSCGGAEVTLIGPYTKIMKLKELGVFILTTINIL